MYRLHHSHRSRVSRCTGYTAHTAVELPGVPVTLLTAVTLPGVPVTPLTSQTSTRAHAYWHTRITRCQDLICPWEANSRLASDNFPYFIKLEGLLPWPQQRFSGPYTESRQPSPHPLLLLIFDLFNIILPSIPRSSTLSLEFILLLNFWMNFYSATRALYLTLSQSKALFLNVFQKKTLYLHSDYKQDRQCTCNVIFTRVRELLLPWENKYYIFVCVRVRACVRACM